MSRVLITGAGGNGYGAQVAKALHQAGRHVLIGADAKPARPSYVPFESVGRLPRASDPSYLESLIERYRSQGCEALFDGSEPEMRLLSRSRERLASEGIRWIANACEVIERCMDKSALSSWLEQKGFATPRSWTVGAEKDADRIDRYPVVVKPNADSGASNHVYVAQSPAELRALFTWLARPWSDFCFQEYVGTPDAEFTVGVLSSPRQETIGSIALRRDLSSVLSRRFAAPNRTGRAELSDHLVISSGVSQGTIEDAAKIREACEEIASALGSAGPLNFQGRWHQGRFYVFEINPRFSGTEHMRAMAGMNGPDLLLRWHEGGVLSFVVRSGMRFRRDLMEFIES